MGDERRAPLTVLTVNPVAVSTWTGEPIRSEADASGREAAKQAVQDAADQAAGKLAGEARPASVTVQALSGNAAEELIGRSPDADLLVVGSRGAGGFARLVLGSVSSQVLHHAHCPVVVIPPEERG
ncbi:MAG: universal stress protein [Actinobacteria bacterium]|nr:universal stress protein [Actinomycetota bacterium]